MATLKQLAPGTRFALAEMPEVTGELVRVTDNRALVKLEGKPRQVGFQDKRGKARHFRAATTRRVSWAADVRVNVIHRDGQSLLQAVLLEGTGFSVDGIAAALSGERGGRETQLELIGLA
jgi:hypothetical protein